MANVRKVGCFLAFWNSLPFFGRQVFVFCWGWRDMFFSKNVPSPKFCFLEIYPKKSSNGPRNFGFWWGLIRIQSDHLPFGVGICIFDHLVWRLIIEKFFRLRKSVSRWVLPKNILKMHLKSRKKNGAGETRTFPGISVFTAYQFFICGESQSWLVRSNFVDQMIFDPFLSMDYITIESPVGIVLGHCFATIPVWSEKSTTREVWQLALEEWWDWKPSFFLEAL